MVQDKSKSSKTDEASTEVESTAPQGKPFNFTREGVVVVAKNRKEAEKKLSDAKKAQKEEEAK